ncbi:MAG: hypothetical protein KTR30_13965 [Saprospiraceae bacterium]|nr:hypothetical protein [Saprospiraceae bacterium]
MKKDIPIRKVEGVALAIVPRNENLAEDLWDTYIVNLKNEPLKSVLVSSKGYGEEQGESLKTTTLRHFFEKIDAEAAVKVEPIQSKLFHLTHEYWISFVREEYMFDKKFIFVKGSIDEAHFTTIPLVNKRGVMIK